MQPQQMLQNNSLQGESKIIIRRPKMNPQLKFQPEKFILKQDFSANKLYKNNQNNILVEQYSEPFTEQRSAVKIRPSNNITQQISGGQDTQQSHYMSDRIERKIQKFSKNQIISVKVPQSSSVKSRNNNLHQNSNSYSNVYLNSLQSFSKNKQASYSPYQTANLTSNLNPSVKVQPNGGGYYGSHINLNHDQSFQHQINDLSFEDISNINNSFTEGQLNPQLNSFIVPQNMKFKKFQNPIHQSINDIYQPQSRKIQQSQTQKKINNQGVFSNRDVQKEQFISQMNSINQSYSSSKIQDPMWSNNMQNNFMNDLEFIPFDIKDEGHRTYECTISDENSPLQQLNQNTQNQTINYHPFIRPKLHLYRKNNSRRIKTSSAARNLIPIYSNESMKAQANKNQLSNQVITEFNSQYTTNVNSKVNNIQSSKLQVLNTKENNTNVISTVDNQELEMQTDLQNMRNYVRPNTTNLETFLSQYSPEDSKKLSQQELQAQINGFKHSFYNDHKQQQENSNSNSIKLDSIRQDPVIQQNQSSLEDSSSRPIQSTKSQQSMKNQFLNPNSSSAQQSEANKAIFLLNAKQSTRESNEESSAQTPCFLRTPNRTNNWGDFKAQEQIIEEEEQVKALFIVNDEVQQVLQQKKPQTSHLQKKVQDKNFQLNNQNNSNKRIDNLNLSPSDINIEKKFIKPNTSGTTFRKVPISRNFNMYDKSKLQQTTMLTNSNLRGIQLALQENNSNKTMKKINKKFQQFKTHQNALQPPSFKMFNGNDLDSFEIL